MASTELRSAASAPARPLCDAWSHPLLGPLQSRVVMTAMTRSRAGPGNVATAAMAAYYARRAQHGVGLVLTESTAIAPVGDGFPDMPRMHTREQIDSWRAVTAAVHAAGSPVFSQLGHNGRISHPDYTDGQQPVSSTATRAAGINRRNNQPYALPRKLEAKELPAICDEFRRAAAGALEAGFDGVELHLAHGYLIDQFLDGHVNDRDDAYGGSIENRCRFALELTEAVLSDCGASRVMIRISPSRWMDGVYDWPDLDGMLEFLVPALDDIGLRLLDVSCARADYFATSGRVIRMIRPLWPHFMMGGASLTPTDAQAEIDAGLLDMVTYGRLLLSNPDLVERIREELPIAPFEPGILDQLD